VSALVDSAPLGASVAARIPLGVFVVDPAMNVLLWNQFMELHTGLAPEAVLGRCLFDCAPELPRRWLEQKVRGVFLLKNFAFTSWQQRPYLFRFAHNRPITGGVDHMRQDVTFIPLKDAAGEVMAVCVVLLDATDACLAQAEIADSLAQLKQVQARLLQAQKLEAVGQLAAGVAHEINTPTQFVLLNTTFLKRACSSMLTALSACEKVVAAARAGTPSDEALGEAELALKKARLRVLRDEVPDAIEQSLDGLRRIAGIVAAMKDFSHPSMGEFGPVDLAQRVGTTLTIARGEWKDVADAVADIEPGLPEVYALRDELAQVLLNLVVNAAHAVASATKNGTDRKGQIVVSAGRDGDIAEIRVRDDGAGIPEAIRGRVFDPFFTTKPVGKGTGQGLARAHAVVVEKHRGDHSFDSEVGRGTTFIVRLPIAGRSASPA
jgi:signal transduction histidine kinase